MSTKRSMTDNDQIYPALDARPFRTSKTLSRKRLLRIYEYLTGNQFPELLDAKAPHTWKSLYSRWRRWEKWARKHSVPVLPVKPETLRDYARDLFKAGVKSSSMGNYLFAISTIAKLRGQAVDMRLTSEFLKAARRRSGPPRQALPLRGTDLAEMRALFDLGTVQDLRDAVAIFLQFAVAGRASEVAGLDWLYSSGTRLGGTGVLTVEPAGLRTTWFNTKTAQATETTLAIPDADLPDLRPLLLEWVRVARIAPGEPVLQPVHKNGRVIRGRLGADEITRVVRRQCERLALSRGLDVVAAKQFARRHSSHSMRRGFCTSAAEAGQSIGVIKARSRHFSDSELVRYVQAAERERVSGLAGLVPQKVSGGGEV